MQKERISAAIIVAGQVADISTAGPMVTTRSDPFVAIYDYTDESGELLFQVCRKPDKAGFRNGDRTAKAAGSGRPAMCARCFTGCPS